MIARDLPNLLMAGRCISGDFHAHASYRVSGNAAVTGQAAGILAALAAKRGTFPANVDYNDVIQEMERGKCIWPASGNVLLDILLLLNCW